jgi:sugar/nucleoside kinase (ribokinase family)
VVDYLLVNDAEARQLGESANLITATNNIFKMGPEVVVVKQGEYGVTVFFASGAHSKKIEIFSAPSVPLESVMDPTGAGDSFAGAFMGYIAATKSVRNSVLRQAVIFGSVVASYAVEGFSIDVLKGIGIEEIKTRFKYLKKISHFEDIKEELNIKGALR